MLARVETLMALKKAAKEALLNANELTLLNEQLIELNHSLEQKIVERTLELEVSNLDLERKNVELARMEAARRHLLSNISHELRTPMTAIQGYAEAIVGGVLNDPDKQKRYFRMILDKTLGLNRLVQDLFELSKLESRRSNMSLQMVDAEPWISRVCDKYGTDIRQAGLGFQCDFLPAEERLRSTSLVMDPDRIDQVLTNLVFNAIHHSDKGDTISLGFILVDSVRQGEVSVEMIVQVRDTGSGITPEGLPHVFERFYRDNRDDGPATNQGSGLGLAISKEIVEYHEGRIWAESELDKGSVFYFTLPVHVNGA